MNIQLGGKLALVSGSTAGIGFAIAKGLGGSGARGIVNGRTKECVQTGIAELKAQEPRGEYTPFAGDLSEAKAADELFTLHPAVDILVNNLGIFEPRGFFEI